jgi:hypothetical protein
MVVRMQQRFSVLMLLLQESSPRWTFSCAVFCCGYNLSFL